MYLLAVDCFATCSCLQSTTDPSTCGTECSDLANCTASLPANVDSAICSAGACAVGTCADTYLDCDGIFENGCEMVSCSGPGASLVHKRWKKVTDHTCWQTLFQESVRITHQHVCLS
jgi:hypothetical protein